MNKCDDELLNKQFFPNLQCDQLLDLHESLEKEFHEVLKFSYEEVYKIFLKNLKKFLIYCTAISKYDITKEFLEDKIVYYDDIRTLVGKLDDESRSKNGKNMSLNDLIYLIPQHIQRFISSRLKFIFNNYLCVRYHVMLADVKKQAKKENKKKIVQEAEKAHQLMYNLAKHINVYTEDYNHILMLTELKDEMDRFKVKGKYKILYM